MNDKDRKRKKEKIYICTGFSYRHNNEHLLGTVGETHSILDWFVLAFKKEKEFIKEYFNGYTDKEMINYLHENAGIRLALYQVFKKI